MNLKYLLITATLALSVMGLELQNEANLKAMAHAKAVNNVQGFIDTFVQVVDETLIAQRGRDSAEYHKLHNFYAQLEDIKMSQKANKNLSAAELVVKELDEIDNLAFQLSQTDAMFWDSIVSAFDDAGSWIEGAANDAVDWVDTAASDVADWADQAVIDAEDWAVGAWSDITDFADWAWDGITEFGQMLLDGAEEVYQVVAPYIHAVEDFYESNSWWIDPLWDLAAPALAAATGGISTGVIIGLKVAYKGWQAIDANGGPKGTVQAIENVFDKITGNYSQVESNLMTSAETFKFREFQDGLNALV